MLKFESLKLLYVISGTDGKTDISTLLDKKWVTKLETENETTAHKNLRDLMDYLRSQKRHCSQKRTINLMLHRLHYRDSKHVKGVLLKTDRIVITNEEIGSSMVNI